MRGRIGFAADRALFYVTGGLAYGDIGVGLQGSDDVKAGWALGAGRRVRLHQQLDRQVEGLYLKHRPRQRRLQRRHVHRTRSSDNGFGVIRAGLNYKF